MMVYNDGTKDDQSGYKKKSEMFSWLYFILLLAGIFFVFRFVIGFTIVNGESMSPTFENNDFLISSNMFYTPDRNDIILFESEDGYDVLKRVIALPNETVEIKDGVVYVNEHQIEEKYTSGIPDDLEKTTVGEGEYFVLGDNRTPGESLDSRSTELGNIDREKIKGEVVFSVFPFESVTTSGK
ncbi:signal peptidase I [Oceanobacillus limi]|uniref:Signal peptidase I n=1 Tax=Oceanobacillus limi TaxID=930131 RepID=A0A1I0BPC8_9BACI|nr:signal peptidase I [Oceanobacillus limi]SET08845.1 signal peptidase I [Oceanobacillus limi]